MKFKIPKTFMGKPVEGAIDRALNAKPEGNGGENQGQNGGRDYDFGGTASDSFILSYDGTHETFAQELIAKSNETFKGTKAEIPAGTQGEITNMYIAKRMALVSTIANNQNLRSAGLWPVTASQSEALLKAGKLVNPTSNWEDLTLLIYSTNGKNQKEALALIESIKRNRSDLGLSESDLEKRLVVVNPGGVPDQNMSYGVKPIVIPGVTLVYLHEILDKTGVNHTFEYGLSGGLPKEGEIGQGSRTLYMPSGDDIGLRVLYRGGDLHLFARGEDLADSNEYGRVHFAPQARAGN
ncbi:MAG: hypothetical protein ABH864_03590 [archaeon]